MSQPGNFVYRAGRKIHQLPTILEVYGETNILPFLRQYFPETANYDFGPLVEAAAALSAKLDLCEQNEGFMDQVIFGVACPELCDEGVKDIVEDRELVILLLVHHLKKHGGVLLPPRAPALALQTAHVRTVMGDLAAGRTPAHMHYGNWWLARITPSPPGSGGAANRGGTVACGGRGGGATVRGGGRGGFGGRGGNGRER